LIALGVDTVTADHPAPVRGLLDDLFVPEGSTKER
jgi:hypothetical protein